MLTLNHKYEASHGDYLQYELFGDSFESGTLAVGLDLLAMNGASMLPVGMDITALDHLKRAFGACPRKSWEVRRVFLPDALMGQRVRDIHLIAACDGCSMAMAMGGSRVLIRDIKLVSLRKRLVVSILPDKL